MSTTRERIRDAREHLAALDVTLNEKTTAYRFVGHRVFDLGVENLSLNTDHLLTMAGMSNLRSVPTSTVQSWVDLAAEVIEADERTFLAEEVESRFGLQADISHAADIDPADVDRYTDNFNTRLREAWVTWGVPADVPDEYFNRCAEAGFTPEQCGIYWRDGIPLELI